MVYADGFVDQEAGEIVADLGTGQLFYVNCSRSTLSGNCAPVATCLERLVGGG